MDRIEKLRENIPKDCCVLLSSLENMRYFSSFNGEGGVILSHDDKIIVTDGRYTEIAKNNSKGFLVVENSDIVKELKTIKKKVFFEQDLPFRIYNRLKNENIDAAPLEINLDEIRSVKDDNEIKNLKEAAQIAQKALISTLGEIKEGVTENFVKAKLEYYMTLYGGENTSFDTICISGPKTSMPHGIPSDRVIKKGEFLTIDFGTVKNGYCSDMTRTFAIGNVTEEMKEVYNVVLSAQRKATEFIKAGVSCTDCDKVAREIIESGDYGKYFVHSLGHGVGLKIHEYPNLSPKSTAILEKGNVVTVEPGIYLEGKFGVRIENTVAVTEYGCEELQDFDKNLIML